METAKLLVQFNADVNVANRYGLTPLDVAHTFGRTGFINMLTDLLNNKAR